MTSPIRRLALAASAIAALALLAPRPAAAAGEKSSVVCKDGTVDEGGRGACSGHGGIDKAATAKAEAKQAAAEKAAKAEAKKEKEEAAKAKREAEKGKAQAEKSKQQAEKGKAQADKAKEQAEAKATSAMEKVKKEADEAATVTCKDGTTSQAGRGACSGHGGVDHGASAKAAGAAVPTAEKKVEHEVRRATQADERPAAREPAAASEKAEKADPAKGPPTARCKDGTLSYAEHHTGACSRHGGVEEWLDKK